MEVSSSEEITMWKWLILSGEVNLNTINTAQPQNKLQIVFHFNSHFQCPRCEYFQSVTVTEAKL